MIAKIRNLVARILLIVLSIPTCCYVVWDFAKLVIFAVFVYFEALWNVIFPPKLKSLAEERILVTGAANGIGRETCLHLARTQPGVTIICWDIDKAGNRTLLPELLRLGAKAYAYDVDVSDRNQVEVYASKMTKQVGEVTMVINNAAIMPCHTFLGHNPRELERLFQVNVLGQFWVLRVVLPYMLKTGRGHVVTVCSAAGLIGTRNMVPYCGTKHAVHGYIQALKNEIKHLPGKPKIDFTTVYPFTCSTRLTRGLQCFSRFPWLLPVLEPPFVAAKIVEGIQRNYEYVYIPAFLQVFGNFAKCLLPKVQDAAAEFFEAHVEPLQ